MRTAIKRHLRRQRLLPIVSELPRLLAERTGPAEHYTRADVARALDGMALKPGIAPFAYAAACNVEEFTRGMPAHSLNDYLRMREEMMQLFWIEHRAFTMAELRLGSFNGLELAPDGERCSTVAET